VSRTKHVFGLVELRLMSRLYGEAPLYRFSVSIQEQADCFFLPIDSGPTPTFLRSGYFFPCEITLIWIWCTR